MRKYARLEIAPPTHEAAPGLSRKQVMQLKTINLNTVLTDMEKLLRRLIGEMSLDGAAP